MSIACSSLAFSKMPLETAFSRIARLGFRCVDLAAFEGWAHVQPSELVTHRDTVVRRVEQAMARYDLAVVALIAGPGTNDAATLQTRGRALLELAHALGANVVTLPAGPRTRSISEAAASLRPLVDMAASLDITLTVETHVGQVTERPEDAEALLRQVPGLGLTFDPSHFYAGPARGAGFEILYPYVRHVHIRDARDSWETVQVAMGSGNVDFRAIFADLRAQGYDGALSIEYIDTIGDLDIETQLIEARRFIEREWPR